VGAGKTVVIRTDVQGARTLRAQIPEALLVFLTAPSIAELEARMRARSADDEAAMQRRLSIAESELAEASRFDHVILNANDGIDAAVDALLAVIEAERARPNRAAPRI
jgi:guanylate kinase